MNIDEFKIEIERHVKACIEDLSRNNDFFNPTIKRYELRLNKGYETILLCNSAVLRVKQLKNNINFLELSKKYMDLFKLQDEVTYTKSDVNWGKLTFDENIAKKIIDNIQSVFKQCYMEESVDSFGCCSRYNACSDEKKCIHPDIIFAKGCMYKKNLDAGRIFYGKNCNIEYLTKQDDQTDSAKPVDFVKQSSLLFQTEDS